MNTKSNFAVKFTLGENQQPFIVTFKSSVNPYNMPGLHYIMRTAKAKLQTVSNVPLPAVMVRITRNGETVWEKDS